MKLPRDKVIELLSAHVMVLVSDAERNRPRMHPASVYLDEPPADRYRDALWVEELFARFFAALEDYDSTWEVPGAD